MRFNLVSFIDAVRDARGIGSAPRLVALMLGAHARCVDGPNAATNVDDRAGIARPSQKLLADETALSPRSVWSALDTLERAGVILVVIPGRQHQPTRYSLMGAIEALRVATAATLNAPSVAPVATLKKRQTRKVDDSDSQDQQCRLAPVAKEGTQGRYEEKVPTLVATATNEALKLEIVEAKTKTDHELVIEAYAEAYGERTGGKIPKRIGGAGGKAVKELIASYGADEAIAIVRRGTREWSKGVPLLTQIAQYADSFRGPASPTKLRPGIQPVPAGGSTWRVGLEEPEVTT